MGVDLGDLCPAKPTSLAELSGKIVAIDAYNTLYQFLAIIRGPDGTPLRDDQGRVTSHLAGLLNRTASFCSEGLYPIYVFDGAPHPLKLKTLEERRRIRAAAVEAYEEALREGDLERARSKAQQTSTLSKEMVEQAKRLLAAFGLPIVQAPGEGEAQGSDMARRGLAHAVGSQDYDAVLFHAPRLLRNLAVTGRRKLPGRQAWADVTPELIEPDAALAALGIGRPQLIDLAILIGTDYNPGVPGIGPKTALKLLKQHGSIEALVERAPTEPGAAWKKLAGAGETLGDVDAIRRIFLDPAIDPSPKIEWGRLDKGAALQLLVGEHRFASDRVQAALEKLDRSPVYRRQKSILDF